MSVLNQPPQEPDVAPQATLVLCFFLLMAADYIGDV